MKELTNILEVPKTLQKEGSLPLLVLISSTQCPWCSAFAPVYEHIAAQMRYHYDACFIKAESVGGREVLREEFSKCFGHKYNGFPTLYIAAANADLHEVKMGVLWDGHARKWAVPQTLAYLRDYSYSKIKGVKK